MEVDIVDEDWLMVSSGEGWGVDRSNGRSYILGPAVNQDPGGNIDKKSGTIWPIDNTTAHHHILLIVQSDLDDVEDNGSSLSRLSCVKLFLVSLTRFVIVSCYQISTNMVRAPVRAPPILVYIGRPYVPMFAP